MTSPQRACAPMLATLCLLVAGTAVHAQAPDPGHAVSMPSEAFTRDLKAELSGERFVSDNLPESRWLDGGSRYTILEPAAKGNASDIAVYDTATGKRSVLVPASRLVPSGAREALSIRDYSWSADKQNLLIFTNAQKVWRRATRGDYWVLRLSDGRLTKLGGSLPAASLMFAKFSPDSRSVAYVSGNNLYVESLAGGHQQQLTHDGSENIINGTTDWVSEEELDLRDAFRWSPDSRSIAYWQFDQSGVGEYTLINDTKASYPQLFRYPYPQPGGVNASVRVGVVAASGGATTWVKLPGDPRQNYIPRMEWVDAKGTRELVLEYLNRPQNRNEVYLVDADTGTGHVLYTDTDAAWVDYVDELRWVGPAEHRSLVWLSERDGWRHAYLISQATGEAKLITRFNGDVIDQVAVDEAGGWYYFTASPDDPIRTYLYRARLDGTGTPERVTPDSQRGENKYDIAPDGRWAIHTFESTVHPPSYELVDLQSGRVERSMLKNDDQVKQIEALDPEPVEFTETAVEKGIKLQTSIVKPPHFDPSKKYPMIVNVYGEPAAALVKDNWHYFQKRLFAREGYVVVSFDNQGTPVPLGRAWRKAIYKQIGILNSRQQSEAIAEFTRSHAYIDPKRVAIWGWSGGGSSTLDEMFRYPGQCVAGVAVAPVPDQRLYDSIYQERYMGLPSEDPKPYEEGSPISAAQGLTGHLLIVHGSGDDNVHFQGTERLVNRLIELNKQFDFMDYPNRTHAISEGPGTSVHVYSLIMRYLEEYVPAGPR